MPARLLEIHPVNPEPRLIREAAEVMRAGGLIVYPTDSCYALGFHIGDKAPYSGGPGASGRMTNITTSG